MTKEGTVLDGKYEILAEVGRGGMSIVYLARDKRLNKQWAVKEIKNDGKKSAKTLLKGLEREANILKNVDHPVLPRIVDIINQDGTIYVVMDYIEGDTIQDRLKKEGAQPQELVVEWGLQLASALNYLHNMNPPVIYRDMKPSNVMIKPEGGVKLIDFGTAKEYEIENNADTTALGTRGYAAPEQFGEVIFQDPSLEAMATIYPVTLEELQNIPGVGAGKAKRYGQEFCVLIKKHCEENEIERPEDLRVRTVANKSKLKVSIIQAIDRKVALDDIAVSKGLEFGELLDEVEAIVYSGTKLNIDYFLEEIMDEDHLNDIYDYFKESTTDKIDDAMDELGDDYTEDEIRLVRIKFISEIAN